MSSYFVPCRLTNHWFPWASNMREHKKVLECTTLSLSSLGLGGEDKLLTWVEGTRHSSKVCGEVFLLSTSLVPDLRPPTCSDLCGRRWFPQMPAALPGWGL